MRNSNTSLRLKQIMTERNLRQVDILNAAKPYCAKYGVKLEKNDLSQYVNGKVEPGQEKLTILGLALDVNETWLMGYDVSSSRVDTTLPDNIFPLPGMREWKVLGGTACGDPLYMDLAGETILAPDNIDADFVFRCVGDSMIGARILDGDIVFVKSGNVENGQIAVVRIGEEYTLKRLYRGEDYLELRAENPAYPPKIIRGEQENAAIIGRAVHFISRVI